MLHRFVYATMAVLLMVSCGQQNESAAPNAHLTPPPANAANPAGSPVDTGPLHGTINGVEVSGFKAFLKDTFLTLYTGEDPNFEYGTRLLLFTDLLSPANQSVVFENTEQFGAWHIHINSKDHPELDKILMKGYGMRFATGDEKDFNVPATLRLASDGDFPVRLEGSVSIKTSGLISHDGVVDRGHDHMDTIAYVAQDHVRSEFEGRAVSFVDPQVSMMHNSNGKPPKDGFVQEAYYVAVFSVDDTPRQIRKLQIAKRAGTWQVVNVLPLTQIRAAHPLNPPHRPKPPYIFKPIAGRRFEKTIYAGQGWKKLKEPSFVSCGGGQREGSRGYCRVTYGVYEGDSMDNLSCSEVTYLFDEVNGEWSLTETLPPEKKFNSKSGEIEERKDGDLFGC